MTLITIIQDRTNDGAAVVEFLVAVMRNELAGFKPCHRLDAAKLLVRYDCNCKPDVATRAEELDYVLNTPPEPSRPRSGSGSSDDTEFDNALARVIRQSTGDGRSVCRFLINVMEGELKAFKPHHRISAARELLTRGFGKHACLENPPLPQGEGWGEGENQQHQPTPTRSPTPGTQTTESHKSPNQINHSSDSPAAEADPETNQHPNTKRTPPLTKSAGPRSGKSSIAKSPDNKRNSLRQTPTTRPTSRMTQHSTRQWRTP